MAKWDKFFEERVRDVLTEKKSVIDIGGGLRAVKKKGNWYDERNSWMAPLLEKISYRVMDPVPDFHPDIVGDIHKIPLPADSEDAIICLSVLEHVEDPIRAVAEMRRVLKQGGYCLVYVPFLYYYHAEAGYYKDYWRFTKDTIHFLFKDFSRVEFENVRGAFAAWVKISPLGRSKIILRIASFIDTAFGKEKSSQTSGYYIFAVK